MDTHHIITYLLGRKDMITKVLLPPASLSATLRSSTRYQPRRSRKYSTIGISWCLKYPYMMRDSLWIPSKCMQMFTEQWTWLVSGFLFFIYTRILTIECSYEPPNDSKRTTSQSGDTGRFLCTKSSYWDGSDPQCIGSPSGH